MDRLRQLIDAHEDWLIDRAVRYAHENDYTRYTSTLREAWRAGIVGLSQPLMAALDEVPAGGHLAGAPMRAAVAFGIEEARNHRDRGIDLALFLGLMKVYRRIFFDLFAEKVPDLEDQRHLTSVLLEMLETIEIELVREWIGTGETVELGQLRAKNRELSNEKNKYLTVFESIAEPTILLDEDDEPLHVNAAGGRMLLGETTPGASYYGDLDTDRLRFLVTEILAQAGRGGADSDQIALDTAIGRRTYSIAIQEMLDISSKFAGRVIILQDVTDYLAAIAAAEDANRAKSAFLTTVSHEVKTPINSIIGLTRLLDGSVSPEHQIHIDAIQTASKHLSELVENILGLSRAEANALQRMDQDFDLCEMIDGLLLIVRPETQAQGLSIEATLAPDVPCYVKGDAQKLRHVLMNLLSNALKFTEQGGVELIVSVDAGARAATPVVHFEVADTGVGLPVGGAEWLFDPFTQYAHPRVDTGVRGTGLGLAICKRLVSFLGGTITARPNPGGGSVFAFDLPLAVARGPQATNGETTDLAVLVVEDDPVNALVAEGYLHELGHRPLVVNSYTDAIAALGAAGFDLVVTDNQLDGATGLDLARFLRAADDPGLTELPVIVVTAAIPDAAGTPAGTVQHFVEKPFDRQDLAQAIRLAMAATTTGAHRRDTGQPATDPGQPDASAAVKAVPLFETRVLNQLLTDLGVERCERIVESYTSNAPILERALARGMSARDLPAVAEAAHRMISAASFVGLGSVSACARDLLDCCKARELRRARVVYAELLGLSQQATAALTDHWAKAIESYGAEE